MTPALRRIDRLASMSRAAYSEPMGPAARSVLRHTRVVAVIVLTLTALACLAGIAHANMGTPSGQDCFGPGCEQRITCAGPDQIIAPTARPHAAPPVTVTSAAIELLPAQNQRLPVAPLLVGPNLRAVCPLAPRSPPAA